jgi:ABC-type multidrug transport system ATPase subunit
MTREYSSMEFGHFPQSEQNRTSGAQAAVGGGRISQRLFQHINHSQSHSSGGSEARGTLFQLSQLGLQLGNRTILEDINLFIDRGEILFLTGPSGAGKTSLLRILEGEITPTRGEKLFHLGQKRDVPFITCVYQDLRLLPSVSLQDNLTLGLRQSAYGKKAHFNQLLNDYAGYFDFKDKLHLKCQDANGGLKQKVALVRALLARPQVLICDEPTSSLDAISAKKVYDLLEHLNKEQRMTVIWASHHREMVQKFNGRIMHLEQGRLVHSGKACFI